MASSANRRSSQSIVYHYLDYSFSIFSFLSLRLNQIVNLLPVGGIEDTPSV